MWNARFKTLSSSLPSGSDYNYLTFINDKNACMFPVILKYSSSQGKMNKKTTKLSISLFLSNNSSYPTKRLKQTINQLPMARPIKRPNKISFIQKITELFWKSQLMQYLNLLLFCKHLTRDQLFEFNQNVQVVIAHKVTRFEKTFLFITFLQCIYSTQILYIHLQQYINIIECTCSRH